MVTMYDSTTANDIPTTVEAVAGYLDGRFQWNLSDFARFPTPYRLGIVTSSTTNAGQFLDVETGDATPGEAPGWVGRRLSSGEAHPGIYCNASTWPAVRAAFAATLIPAPLYWVADWPEPGQPGMPHLLPGSWATQYVNPPASGGHFDLSLTDGTWPWADVPAPAPVPPAPPAPVPVPPATTTVIWPIISANSPPSGYVLSLRALFRAKGFPALPLTNRVDAELLSVINATKAAHGWPTDGVAGPRVLQALTEQ